MGPIVAVFALALERIVGYSPNLTARIGHPVIWFGHLIALFDRSLNRPRESPEERRKSGIFALFALLMVTFIGSLLVVHLTRQIPQGWVLEFILATPFLAQKELGQAVAAVARGLDQSLADGRSAVSHIVGRDPEVLDEAGVSRAAIETLAENTSDGVIAPLFWLFIGGLPGIALYKAINTADSMVGHLDDKYREFGWASAKLDDLVNYVPARITAGLIALASFLVRGANPIAAWRIARRDAPLHASPNAGWPEAAMAGALGFALGGPRAYDGETVDLPRFGDGRTALNADDIRTALRLYERTLDVTLWLSIVVALVLVLVL
jgi:adenosylcobinamide-phosphate synthase